MAGGLLTADLPAAAADGTAATLGPWLFGSVALVLVSAAAYALGSLRAAQRQAAALRASHRDSQSLGQLLESWHWQTDPSHRLQHLQPPPGADHGPGPAIVGDDTPLWARYEVADADDTAGLRARLESHVPFANLRVRQAGSGAGWLLRAVPRFDDAGRFAGYAGTARPTDDDDARRADQLALQACVDLLPVAALIAVAGQGGAWTLRHANPAARLALAASADSADPADRAPLRWEDALPRLPPALQEALAAPAGVGSATSAAADGPAGWLLRRLPLPFTGGQALLLVQAARGEPAAAEAQIESESFIYTVSHDLRAPIRVVDGFTRILKEDYGRQLDRVGNDHLDRVLGASARMNHMIDALLTLARLSSLPLAQQPVNLSQLAGFIVDDLRRSAPDRTVDVRIEPDLAVTGDPTLLRLVLENLLGNAWKYSARVKRTKIVFGAEMQDQRRVFVVRDNGAGFDMRSADRLFGLFQRLHSATDFPGTGVGLASVQRIVRRHGGEIWADGEPGRGAAFYFTLRG